MPAEPSAHSCDLELARGIVDAWSRGDVQWLLENSAADVELRPAMWTGAPFRGLEGTVAFMTELIPAYEGLTLEVERVRQAEDPVALDVHVRAHLRESDAEFDDRFTFLFWFRDGKLVCYEGNADEPGIAAAMARRMPGGD